MIVYFVVKEEKNGEEIGNRKAADSVEIQWNEEDSVSIKVFNGAVGKSKPTQQ